MTTISIRTPAGAIPAEEAPRGPDYWLLIPALALTAFGVAMVFSASIPFCSNPESGKLFHYLWRELLFVGVGSAAMLGMVFVPLRAVRRWTGPLLVVTFALLAGLFVVGTEVNGARCWYSVMGFSFQPSEMAKVVLVLYLARVLARYPRGVTNWRQAVHPLLVLGLVVGLIAVEPDMGTAAVIVMAMFVFLHIGGLRMRDLAAAGAPAAVFGGLMLKTHPYQVARIKSFVLIVKSLFVGGAAGDFMGAYQQRHSLVALGSGGLTGRGYFQGVEKYYYLPEVTTDSILPVIGEELGFAATALVVILFAVLVWRGMIIARGAPDRFAGLAAAGITSLIGVQALLNMAVATGLAPATGVTLPFVSYGGSSLLFSMIGLGLVMNVSRTIPRREEKRGPDLRVIGA